MQAEERRGPRVRMVHLMIWVVGCAVGFAAYRSITPPEYLRRPAALAIVTGYNLAMGTAFGTILTGCTLLACRRWGGDRSYPSRAGHWLLIFGLAAAAADVAAVMAFYYRDPHDPAYSISPYITHWIHGGPWTWPAGYHQAVGWSVGTMAGLGFLLALRRRLPRHWLAVFATFTIVGAVQAVGHIPFLIPALHGLAGFPLNRLMSHVYAGSVLLGTFAILWALTRDWRSDAPTDGLHRLGIGVWLAIGMVQMSIFCLFGIM